MTVRDILSVAGVRVRIIDFEELTEIAYGLPSEIRQLSDKILNAEVLSVSGDCDNDIYRKFGSLVGVITVYIIFGQ